MANTLQEKKAVQMGESGTVESAISNTLGRVHPGVLVSAAIAGTDAWRDPKAHKKDYEDIVNTFNKVHPDALKNTLLRTGPQNIVEDLLWKKYYGEEAKDKRWYDKLGGRVFQNPNTSLLMKPLAAASYPAGYLWDLIMSGNRSAHYNPWTDVAHIPIHQKAVAEHELGHAADFQTLFSEKPPENYLTRQAANLGRDLYGLSYGLPLVNLYHEREANRHSYEVLKQILDQKKFKERVEDRHRTLPAAYGTYVGNALVPFNPLLGLVGGIAGGKAYSRATEKDVIQQAMEEKKMHDKYHGNKHRHSHEKEAQHKLRAIQVLDYIVKNAQNPGLPPLPSGYNWRSSSGGVSVVPPPSPVQLGGPGGGSLLAPPSSAGQTNVNVPPAPPAAPPAAPAATPPATPPARNNLPLGGGGRMQSGIGQTPYNPNQPANGRRRVKWTEQPANWSSGGLSGRGAAANRDTKPFPEQRPINQKPAIERVGNATMKRIGQP